MFWLSIVADVVNYVDFPLLPTLSFVFIRAPPSKIREPYSNHFVCLSVCLSTLRCNAMTQRSVQPRDFILHTQMEDKERKTPIDFGVKRSKVKVIVTCPPPSGALSDCVSFLVYSVVDVVSCSDWLTIVADIIFCFECATLPWLGIALIVHCCRLFRLLGFP